MFRIRAFMGVAYYASFIAAYALACVWVYGDYSLTSTDRLNTLIWGVFYMACVVAASEVYAERQGFRSDIFDAFLGR